MFPITLAYLKGLYFNGSSDTLTVPSTSSLSFGTSNFTIEGWFYFTSVPARAVGLIDGQGSYTPSFYWGQNWTNLAALMQLSLVVIGNDSGPVNVAGTLDVPALALCGPTTAVCFSHVPSVEVVTSALECTGCYFGEPFRAACDQGCRSLFMLEPELVVTKIKRMLRPTNIDKIKKVLATFN